MFPPEWSLERPPRPAAATHAAAVAGPARPLSERLLRLQLLFGIGDKSFALRLLARELPCPADRLGLFPVLPLGGLFVRIALLHLAKHAFALHFLFQNAERLVDVVIADEDLQGGFLSRLDEWAVYVGLGFFRSRQAHEIFKHPGDQHLPPRILCGG